MTRFNAVPSAVASSINWQSPSVALYVALPVTPPGKDTPSSNSGFFLTEDPAVYVLVCAHKTHA